MKRLPFLFLLVVCVNSYAQSVLENNPPSVKWYQVNTPHFRVIFPEGFDVQGQRVANTLEHIHAEEARTMENSIPRKISVILQNQSALANGFVSQLPRRSEFYGMPPQDYNYVGNTDWLDLLSSHEFRHIVQYQQALRGFNKLFYYAFGATAFTGMAQAAAPMWFWEGDAVATETAFTSTGRGRIPNFGLVFKTNVLEGRSFNYHKQYLRSYKHNIPDHYVLGYYMVSYLRKRTDDPDIWGKITRRSWTVPFNPFAFSNAIRKETGLPVTKLYREMAKDLKKEWEEDLDKLELTPFEQVSQRENKAYTDYQYPQAMDDGSVIVMKSGIGDIQTFSLIKDGKEKKIYRPGYVNDAGMLSLAGNKLVWTEYGYHPRYLVKNYSLVKTFDLTTKKRAVIGSKKGRYGSAAISADASRIVAIETSTDYQTSVVIIDAKSGNVEKKFNNPDNNFYSMPRWSANGTSIVLLKTKHGKKSIVLLNADSGSEQQLTPATEENIGHPVLYGEYVFFNSGETGIDNIYAVSVKTRDRFQVTSSRYGAYNPSIPPSGKFIYYNEQTKDGLDVVRIPFDPASWTKFEEPQQTFGPQYAATLIAQEGKPEYLLSSPATPLSVRKYSKLRGIINPYAWGINVDTDLTQAMIGIASKDVLSTTAIDLGYAFDLNERTGAWRGQISYQAWFPILDLAVSAGNRSVSEGTYPYQKIVGGDTVQFRRDLTFDWKEKSIQGGIRVPLLLTRSKYYTSIALANNIGYTQITDFRNNITGGGRELPYTIRDSVVFREYADNGTLAYNHFSIEATHLLKQSRRDINSRWGQRLIINAYNTPFGGDFSGSQFSAYGMLYFPGIAKHHSLWGYGAYQYTEISNFKNDEGRIENYTFRNRIPLPRGFSFPRLEHFYTGSINYTMPLWYPDVAIGPVLNIQRVRINGFVDYGFLTSEVYDYTKNFLSTGVELKVDVNIMRFFPQFDVGVRFTRGLRPSVTDFEVLIGTFNF